MAEFFKEQLWWREELECRLQEHRFREEEARFRRVLARLRRSIEQERAQAPDVPVEIHRAAKNED